MLVGAAAIDARHGRALDDPPLVVAERLEVELAFEHLERAVGRSVVDDDHLELGIVEGEHRPHGDQDHPFLVVGGHDHAHRRREPRVAEHAEVLRQRLAAADRVVEARHDQHQRGRANSASMYARQISVPPVDGGVHRCPTARSRRAARPHRASRLRPRAAPPRLRPPDRRRLEDRAQRAQRQLVVRRLLEPANQLVDDADVLQHLRRTVAHEPVRRSSGPAGSRARPRSPSSCSDSFAAVRTHHCGSARSASTSEAWSTRPSRPSARAAWTRTNQTGSESAVTAAGAANLLSLRVRLLRTAARTCGSSSTISVASSSSISASG